MFCCSFRVGTMSDTDAFVASVVGPAGSSPAAPSRLCMRLATARATLPVEQRPVSFNLK
jgi:hypothetical protein